MELVLDDFRLESGRVLRDVPVAYRTWGRLNGARDNALIICHALTGSADVDEWWAPLLGPGLAFDTEKFFVVCANVLGSCYGTAGPTSIDPDTGKPYGIDFPIPTIRDTVRLHRRLFERIGIRRAVAAIGGSMGGMQVLEWAFEDDFVQALVPIAVGGRHSAWCIGWSEAQRQAIYADPAWKNGYYDPDEQPAAGMAAARMSAMISYRSRESFERRFGRTSQNGSTDLFAMESYLRYQGHKLVGRFDANTYIRLSQSMDTHDVSRGRGAYPDVLRDITQPALVVGVDSDVLYPVEEQLELVEHMASAALVLIESPHGHDAFLIEFEYLNEILTKWLQKVSTLSVAAL